MTDRPNVITVYNSKGGVGKTTLIELLAVFLAGIGKRVCVIDLDYQGTQSIAFGLLDEAGRGMEALHLVLQRQLDITSAMYQVSDDLIPHTNGSVPGAVYVVPGGRQTETAIEDITANPVRYRMANTLDVVRGPVAALTGVVDAVLIDMGPSSEKAALAGLAATDQLIIPTQMDYWSVLRIAPVIEELQVAQQIQPNLTVAAIVPVMTRYYFGGLRRAQVLQVGEEMLTSSYDDYLLRDSRGVIDFPDHEDVRKAAYLGATVLTADVSRQVRDNAVRLLLALVQRLGVD